MILAATGHRPDKFKYKKYSGYAMNNPLVLSVRKEIRNKLKELKPEVVYSGMALGVDQWLAELCLIESIPFIAAIPFIGQEKAWPQLSQDFYHILIERAKEKIVVCEGGYTPWKMQRRNEFMVDHCDILISVWDGSSGGTANCTKYAESKGKNIIRINPNDYK